MALTVIDNRIVRSEADATTGWTGTTSLFSTDPIPIEDDGELGASVGATGGTPFQSYHTAAATNYSNHVIYCWVFSRLALGNANDTLGGLMVYAGDATNAGGWKVAGADRAAFRHDQGPTGWQCPALDTANLPVSPVTFAGAAGSVDFTNITRVGTAANSLVPAPGMNPTYLVDIIRILDVGAGNGCALNIITGSSSDPGTFLQLAQADRSTGSLQAHGIVRELGSGVYGVQGPIAFGTGSGTESTWFEDRNLSVIFEDRGFRNTLYKIIIEDNGVGTTTFKIGDKVGTGTSAVGNNGATFTAPIGVGALFDSKTDTDVTDVFIYGSTFTGFTNGIFLGGPSQEFIGNIVNGSGTIITSGSLMYNCNINNSTATSSLYWNINLDTSGYIDGCTFLGSGSTNHAIEYGPNAPASSSLTNMTFTSYGASNTSASAVYNNSGKALQITLGAGTATPTIRNGTGASTVFVENLIQVTLTGLVTGSEVRVMEANTANEISGTGLESVPTEVGNHSFFLSQGTQIDIVVHNIQYEYLRIDNFAVPGNDTSIPIQQRFDRNYENL